MAKKFTHTIFEPGGKKTTTTRAWPSANYGATFTDKKFEEVRTRLRVIYQQASSDLFAKQADFLHKHQKRADRYWQDVQSGLLSVDDYNAWMQGQLFQQRAWELKRGQLARMMADYDRQAMEIVNNGKLDVFAENANWMMYKLETGSGMTTSFGVINRDALQRLIRDDPRLLPLPTIDEGKDVAWYNKIITNTVTHGILQGETIKQIAARIAEETGDRAYNTLLRNARTAYTGAQNAGEQLSMKRARDELGIRIQKRWMATLDDKTRDAHADLDGQIAEIDEPFDSLLGPIDYPGDPDAEPANVYNCRCGMDEVFPGYSATMYRTDSEGNVVGNVTYREWQRSKMGEG